MGKSKISVIIAREFAVRVKKKSFILTTLLTPLLFAALMVVPGLIAMYSEEDAARKIAVVDNSGVVMPYMQSDDQVEFCQVMGVTVDDLKADFDKNDYYAVVGISALDSSKNVSVVTYSKKQLNMDLKGRIASYVEEAVEQYKLQGYGIPQLDQIMADIESDVKVNTYTLDDSGQEKVSKVEIFMVIGYIASFLIYMFIFMFGSMVMRSVIEEKTTRIIEVIVSSVKPFQIMMGKIIGVASVALTQFFIWIVFTLVIVTVAGNALGINEAAQTMSSVSSEVPVAEITSAMQDDSDGLLQALKDVNYVGIIGCFIIYFVLGYLLYSSMFAAVGAAVDNEADTQQLILPITMPLIIGLFLMLHTFQYPDSALSFWGSVIPFTSPMVTVKELKEDEFSELYEEEKKAGEEKIGGEDFVTECLVDSDLELLFPNEYIPSSSERMLLYRELDGLEEDKELFEFRSRLEDRFGKLPPESEELLRIAPLRRLAKRLGAEKLVLKSGCMTLYFVSNPDSIFYESKAFGKVITYMGMNPRRCNLREKNGKRSMIVQHVGNVETAVSILQEIVGLEG